MVERIRTLLDSRRLTPTQFADLIGVARPIVSHILSGRNKPSLEVVQRILAAMPELAMPWLLNGSGSMLAATGAPAAKVVPAPVYPSPPAVAPAVEPAESVQPAEKQLNANNSPVAVVFKRAANIPDGGPAGRAAKNLDQISKLTPFKSAALPKRFITKPAAATKPNELEEPEVSKPVELAPELVMAPTSLAGAVTASRVTAALLPSTVFPAANALGHTGGAPRAASATSESAMADALFAGAEKPIRRIVIFYRDGSFTDYQPE